MHVHECMCQSYWKLRSARTLYILPHNNRNCVDDTVDFCLEPKRSVNVNGTLNNKNNNGKATTSKCNNDNSA